MINFMGDRTPYFPLKYNVDETSCPAWLLVTRVYVAQDNLPADLKLKFKLCHSVNTIYLD